MIPIGTPAQQMEPKHRRVRGEDDVRTYAAHVCPGMHCVGRARGMTMHRHTEWPVHTLTPEQAAAATEYAGRVR